MGDIFAILVNPRDGRLYSAVGAAESGRVTICDLAGHRMGNGYLDTEPTDYTESAEVTGLPRAHTPDGVTTKGGGLGTVLYTAMCARAHADVIGALGLPDITPGRGGDGISSETAARTHAADAWWERARERFGLAQEVKGCVDRGFSGTQTIPSKAVVSVLADAFGVTPKSLRLEDYDLSARGSYEDCDAVFDAYPYRNAADAHLVVALVKSEYEEPKVTGIDPASLVEVDPLALAAANVAALRKPNLQSPVHPQTAARIFGWLLQVAESAGVPSAQIDRMRLRFITGTDEDPRSWSEVLDPSGYLVERENPSVPWHARTRRSRTPKLVRANGRQRVYPGSTGHPRVLRVAPPLRANPSTTNAASADAAAEQAVRDLHALRASLGWGAFADHGDGGDGGEVVASSRSNPGRYTERHTDRRARRHTIRVRSRRR